MIRINTGNIAKKYGVDFAIKKDKTVDPPHYVAFFKEYRLLKGHEWNYVKIYTDVVGASLCRYISML